jgi:hypothetical protein
MACKTSVLPRALGGEKTDSPPRSWRSTEKLGGLLLALVMPFIVTRRREASGGGSTKQPKVLIL